MKRLVVLVGASGAGKSTVAEVLSQRTPWKGHTHYFDSIGVPSPEEMEARHGSGEGWQEWATRLWVDRLAATTASPELLEGQTRPHWVLEAAERHANLEAQVILLDCSSEVRRHRLVELRNRPELASPRMDTWAAYLAGQAHALGLPIIDTSASTPDEVALEVESVIGLTARQ